MEEIRKWIITKTTLGSGLKPTVIARKQFPYCRVKFNRLIREFSAPPALLREIKRRFKRLLLMLTNGRGSVCCCLFFAQLASYIFFNFLPRRRAEHNFYMDAISSC